MSTMMCIGFLDNRHDVNWFSIINGHFIGSQSWSVDAMPCTSPAVVPRPVPHCLVVICRTLYFKQHCACFYLLYSKVLSKEMTHSVFEENYGHSDIKPMMKEHRHVTAHIDCS